MESGEYGVGRYLDEPYESALPRVVEALKTEGFGVVSEIDVRQTMKEKLGVDVPPHTILGACNPTWPTPPSERNRTSASCCPATSSSMRPRPAPA